MYPLRLLADSQTLEMFSEAEWEAISVRAGLTRRQRQVARLLCLGYENTEIGRTLLISRNTVRLHVRALFRRLGVRRRIWIPVKLIPLFRDWQRHDEGGIGLLRSITDDAQELAAIRPRRQYSTTLKPLPKIGVSALARESKAPVRAA